MILFYFEPKTDMFFYDKNEQAILKAGAMINQHRAEIEAGKTLRDGETAIVRRSIRSIRIIRWPNSAAAR